MNWQSQPPAPLWGLRGEPLRLPHVATLRAIESYELAEPPPAGKVSFQWRDLAR